MPIRPSSPDVQLHSVALRSQFAAASVRPTPPTGTWHQRAESRRSFFLHGAAIDPQRSLALTDPLARSPKLARLEAALFAADGPLHARRLAQVAALADGTEARTLLRQLNDLYDAGGSAFRVESIAGGYQLFTRPEFSHWLVRRHRQPADVHLSGPALETLSIVAYRQPILRAEVESIRGVQCGEVLRHLLDMGLLRIVARDRALGRPLLYGTTRKFLQVFGLKSLDELPLAERLRSPARQVTSNE